jgi:hypothetical protein
VEKQTGRSIKSLRTDGGGEYVNKDMRQYLTDNGIRHETTVSYTPEQNGVSERYNRTLLECVRAIMISANIPNGLWAEVATTAAYLRNRIPSTVNEGRKSPYEVYHDKKPNVEHLRIIWSDAYAHTPKPFHAKLTPRATKFKLIGYHEEKKAYKLWDQEAQDIKISRDVLFDESTVLNLPPITSGNDEFLVDSILDERVDTDGSKEYLVKWTGYEDTTWEPREHLIECEALDEWERQHPESAEIFLSASLDNDPTSFDEAMHCPAAPLWKEAIGKELESIYKNGTWDIVDGLPPGRQPIGCKWIFKRKLRPDGSVDKYKARLVAKGYSQQFGFDYDETFAPVAKFTSIRVILSVAAVLDLEAHQMDVKCAFLNGDLEEEIYMVVPEGVGTSTKGQYCRLRRALYGLKQSSRCWYAKIDRSLTQEMNFCRLESDHAIYVRKTDTLVIVAIYVDDSIIAGDPVSVRKVKETLSRTFEMTDGGELSYFLGMQVRRDRRKREITISQSHLIEQILRRFGMNDAKPLATPMDVSVKLQPTPDNTTLADATIFRQIIGSLMYVMIGTRPDLAASISIISQFSANPSDGHLHAAKRVLRYLRKTTHYKLHLGAFADDNSVQTQTQHLQLYGYSDASWGDDLPTRRSTSGYVFYLSKGPVSWSSKKQATVALSSTEAEYMALTHAAKEAIWLRRFLTELRFEKEVRLQLPTIIHEDNQSAIALAKNPIHHARSKHIDIQFHFIRERIEAGEIELVYTPTEHMTADILTKALAAPKFEKQVRDLQLHDDKN